MASKTKQVHVSPSPRSVVHKNSFQNKALGPVPQNKNGPASKMVKHIPDTTMGSGKKVLPKIRSMKEKFDSMISGCLDNLPPKSPSEIRIFLSSTFSDMRAERNWLCKVAYPHIKTFCADNLDLDFQVVDLRWGITDAALNDHSTEKICLQEIENCQKASLGPNFVCILGDRYGYQPIPTEIAVKEFELILEEAKQLKLSNQTILTKWYKRDDNNIPPLYVLQPINSIIRNFGKDVNGNSLKETAQAKEAKNEWNTECEQLKTILRRSVSSLHQKGALSAERKHEYYKSVTEQEVDRGILDAKESGAHTLCFTRRLTGLPDKLPDKNALRHIDTVNSAGMDVVDKEVEKLRLDLQTKKIPSKLPRSRLSHNTMDWESGGISPDEHPHHQEYITKFCQNFAFSVCKMIEEAKYVRETHIPVSEYYTGYDELLHHLHFCNTKCDGFRGQEDILEKIRKLLADPKSRHPVVLHAMSGYGKTSIMAMVMKMLPTWFGPDCTRLIRFLGTSPESSDVYNVLVSVIGQLADDFDMLLEPLGYKNITSLVKYLPRFLRNVSRATKGHVFILLDSIDQLSDTDSAYLMKWLPTELPQNVHFIISMLPDLHRILENTREIVPEKGFVEVSTLPTETVTEIMSTYLRRHNRKLQPDQERILLADYEKIPRPLYLKLMLDQARHWPSYRTTSSLRKNLGSKYISMSPAGSVTPKTGDTASSHSQGDILKGIQELFTRLQETHGTEVILKSLGYLTEGLNGLTEVELEDVLSCDDDVLNAVYIYHNPPVPGTIRVPSLLWKRIYHSLQEYIVERQSQGKRTMYWYHRQFIEGAKASTRKMRENLHTSLAMFYACEDGLKKTITLEKRKITITDADRQITPQPMVARNKRMLQALPFHLIRSRNPDLAKKKAFCNLRFMMTKIQGFNLKALLKDYDDYCSSDMEPDEEISLLRKSLAEMRSALQYRHLPVELLSRLPVDKEAMPYINKLIKECRSHLRSSDNPAVIPMYPCLGNSMQEKIALTNFSKILSMSADRSRMLIVTSGESGGNEQIKVVNLEKGSNKKVEIADAECVVLSENGLKIWLVKTVKQSNRHYCLAACYDSNSVSPNCAYELPLMEKSTKIASVEAHAKTITIAFADFRICCYLLETDAKKTSTDLIVAKLLYDTKLDLSENEGLVIQRVMTTATKDNISVIALMDSASDDDNASVVISNSKGKVSKLDLSGRIVAQEACFTDYKKKTDVLVLCNNSDAGNFCKFSCYKIGVESQSIVYSFLSDEVPGQLDVYINQGTMAAFPGAASSDMVTVDLLNGIDNIIPGYAVYHGPWGLASLYANKHHLIYGFAAGKIGWVNQEEGEMYIIDLDVPIVNVFLTKNMEEAVVITKGSFYVFNTQDLIRGLNAKNNIRNMSLETNNNKSDGPMLLQNDTLTVAAQFIKRSTALVTLSSDGKLREWSLKDRTLRKVKDLGVAGPISEGCLAYPNPEKKSQVLVHLPSINQLMVESVATEKHGKKIDNVHAFCCNRSGDYFYVLTNTGEGRYSVIPYALPDAEAKDPIPISEVIGGNKFSMKLSDMEEYIILAVECPDKELQIIQQTEKKSHMNESSGRTKFYGLCLASGTLKICYRQLSKVAVLGVSWEVYKDNCVAIGLKRTAVIWDMVSEVCDQRLIKGSKVAQVYRPEWIEDAGKDHGTICHGDSSCMARSPGGDILAVGSEDGFLMAYKVPHGGSIVKDMGKKPNHGGQVTHVAISPDSRWIASYSRQHVLKVWDVNNSLREVASICLSVEPLQIVFSDTCKHLCLCGKQKNNKNCVFLFSISDPSEVKSTV